MHWGIFDSFVVPEHGITRQVLPIVPTATKILVFSGRDSGCNLRLSCTWDLCRHVTAELHKTRPGTGHILAKEKMRTLSAQPKPVPCKVCLFIC